MQGELQRRYMTQESQQAWDAWSQYTVELRVVRALSHLSLPCYTCMYAHAALALPPGSWLPACVRVHLALDQVRKFPSQDA